MAKKTIKKPTVAGRLKTLKAEQQKAVTALGQLDAERNRLTQLLLEMQGAIKVLEELNNGEQSQR
jgi:hypothetical protein